MLCGVYYWSCSALASIRILVDREITLAIYDLGLLFCTRIRRVLLFEVVSVTDMSVYSSCSDVVSPYLSMVISKYYHRKHSTVLLNIWHACSLMSVILFVLFEAASYQRLDTNVQLPVILIG